jgi:hypothetical protein
VTYLIISIPAFLIEFWLEKIGRPSPEQAGARIKAGEDLEAKGLTEYMFDVVYWTWGCLITVAMFGEKAWWMWVAIPAYGGYMAWSLATGFRKGGLGGALGGASDGTSNEAVDSKRRAKMEKRGGKVVYR